MYKVFVIMPFGETYLDLYEELKKEFSDKFEFTNAGDLDNQQNIIKDIVDGIYEADVIIADLTGLNPNVFYELGLAHAMNKKVIIITQKLDELPFDIKSYRANEYSLQFNKIPKLISELEKLLSGAVDGRVEYGNPVSDYIPDFYKKNTILEDSQNSEEQTDDKIDDVLDEEDGGGIFDYIADIEDCSKKMAYEINTMGSEMGEMNAHIQKADSEIKRVKEKSENVDTVFVRNVCRKLSEPIDAFAQKLKGHVKKINEEWEKTENRYLLLLNSKYIQLPESHEKMVQLKTTLSGTQSAITQSNAKIEELINALQSGMGMERRLNRAVSSLMFELEEYLKATEAMFSSIDRIKGKVLVIEENMNK